MQYKEFGLIGKTLGHSYSKIIHNKFGKYNYDLIELLPEELGAFAKKKELKGYNVTIPYKKDIIQYLDVVSEQAQAIGAVNTVVNRGGKLYGYNTDYMGMKYMLNLADISVKDRVVMILGSGGTSNTAVAVCKSLGAREIITVSRSGKVNYQNCYDIPNVQILINTTPVGMYPNTDQSPVDLAKFTSLIGVADVIYNPNCSKLIYQAKELKLKAISGLPMLVAQAKYAMDLFLDEQYDDGIIEQVLFKLKNEMQNIVLIGMPSCGKSSIGERVAKALNREFIDIDKEIEKQEKKTIPQIFAEYGEEYFRKVEKQVTLKICANSGKVISTGGGVVKDKDNLFALKQNGKVILINRDIDKLISQGRPLSKDKATIFKLYQERKELYNLFADVSVSNDGEIQTAVEGVITSYENISN